MITDPKLLLDIWGIMISAGRDAILWAVRLHSEVCLHGLMHLLLLFPFGNNAARRGHQKKKEEVRKDSSKDECQSGSQREGWRHGGRSNMCKGPEEQGNVVHSRN